MTQLRVKRGAALGQRSEDRILPAGAVLLASSERTKNQAYHFPDKHIYCTQFHPELNAETLLDRLRNYPTYIKTITGLDYGEFLQKHTGASPHTDALLPRFARHIMGEI